MVCRKKKTKKTTKLLIIYISEDILRPHWIETGGPKALKFFSGNCSPLPELLEALLHGSRWKSTSNSKHKLDQLFTALRDFLLLVAAENKMLNKEKSQPERAVCLQWLSALCSGNVDSQWQSYQLTLAEHFPSSKSSYWCQLKRKMLVFWISLFLHLAEEEALRNLGVFWTRGNSFKLKRDGGSFLGVVEDWQQIKPTGQVCSPDGSDSLWGSRSGFLLQHLSENEKKKHLRWHCRILEWLLPHFQTMCHTHPGVSSSVLLPFISRGRRPGMHQVCDQLPPLEIFSANGEVGQITRTVTI